MSQRDLSLKVMRLSRPTLAKKTIEESLTNDQLLEAIGVEPTLTDAIAEEGGPIDNLLTLPPSFGHIYLGETFKGYVCITNLRNDTIHQLRVKVEMQIGGAAGNANGGIILLEVDRQDLSSSESAQGIAQHDVNQLGPHVLVVTVTYRKDEDGQDETLRKFYKFAALNPLNVRTKVHTTPAFPLPTRNMQDDQSWQSSSTNNAIGTQGRQIYLEVQIQNLTHQAINFERLALECAPGWALRESFGSDEIMRDSLGVKNTVQMMYSLIPNTRDDSMLRKTPNLGRLDIVWRNVNGESGRLLTSMLGRRVPQHVLDAEPSVNATLRVLKAPKSVRKQVPFDIEFEVEIAGVRSEPLLLDAVIQNWSMDKLPSQVGSPNPAPSPIESCFPIGSPIRRLQFDPGQKEARWKFSWCAWGPLASPIIRPGSIILRSTSEPNVVFAKLDCGAEIDLKS